MPERYVPEHLYKYREMSSRALDHLRDTIVNGKIYFSIPAAFNDPFDCNPALSMKSTKAEFSNYLKGFFKRRFPELSRAERRASASAIVKDPYRNQNSTEVKDLLTKAFTDMTNWIGVLSLSAINDDILMWAHYADSHQGVCLRFSTKNGFFKDTQEVVYQDERPIVKLIRDTPMDFQHKAVLYKASHWEYEKEWRIIDHGFPGHGVHQYPQAALDGIIFGAKTSDSNKALIREWIAPRGNAVELLQARVDPRLFGLQIGAI